MPPSRANERPNDRQSSQASHSVVDGGGGVGPSLMSKLRFTPISHPFPFYLTHALRTNNTHTRPRSSSSGGAVGGGGNLLTRRLCRTRRRRDDNELYRSNSFKFERFERKDGGAGAGGRGLADGSRTLSKQVRGRMDLCLPL